MKIYETPSLEIEYFTVEASVICDVSHNTGTDIDDVGNPFGGPAGEF